jgi:CxxC-x17-CxxC domain-containing protein
MEERKMHKAVCDECKKECEVPFEPTEGKPVLCQECFSKSRDNRSSFKRDFSPRQEHDAVCAECGQKCTVPFKPTEDRPVYCRECYAKKSS